MLWTKPTRINSDSGTKKEAFREIPRLLVFVMLGEFKSNLISAIRFKDRLS